MNEVKGAKNAIILFLHLFLPTLCQDSLGTLLPNENECYFKTSEIFTLHQNNFVKKLKIY